MFSITLALFILLLCHVIIYLGSTSVSFNVIFFFSGDFSLTKEVGLFSNVQLKNVVERLGEQDASVTITEDEEVEEVGTRQSSVLNSEQQVLLTDHQDDGDPEEDFRIEEYTDDW